MFDFLGTLHGAITAGIVCITVLILVFRITGKHGAGVEIENGKLKTGDGKIFLPDFQRVNYSNKFNIATVNTIADGELVYKNKNYNRRINLDLRFDPFTAQKFSASLQNKKTLKLFDLMEFSGMIDVFVESAEYAHNFVDNYNYVKFSIAAVEEKPPKKTISPLLSAAGSVLTVFNAIQKAKQINVGVKLINACATLIMAPVNTFMEIKTFATNYGKAISAAWNLQTQNAHITVHGRGEDGIKKVLDLQEKTAEIINSNAQDLTKKEFDDILTAFEFDYEVEKVNLISKEEKTFFVDVMTFPVYNLSCLLFSLDFTKYNHGDIMIFQKNIYEKLLFFTELETDIEPQDFNLPSVFLLDVVTKLQFELERAKQKRSVFLEKFTDIYPLVFRLYKPKTADEYEKKFLDFVELNNIKGESLFGLPPGKEVFYYE
ncbi:MAG: hypothetical protein FWF51_12480 [Chitinivibrionia bacterium]|nr:hypothetical protein [Chitinivibrionia bacterium]